MKNIFRLLLLLAVAGGAAYFYFFKANVPTDLRDEYIKIPSGTSFEDLVKRLDTEGVVIDAENFRQWANWYKFDNPRAGRFKIKAGWSSADLIKHLQRGEQAPVKVVLNNERTPNQVAAKIAKVLERDSATFAATFQDTAFLDSLGLKNETLMCVFLPNTYEFFWNVEPRKYLERMTKEYRRFWNDERTAKAKAQGLTPEQVITMASIVDGEARDGEELKKVAAAYLNRLKTDMKLDADPTVQFALMEIEKTASFRRLLNKDYEVPHPYNTYLNKGLPPGPVCMPRPVSVEAVLNPAQHNYVFFVAKPDNSHTHNYSETYAQHLAYVKIYQDWLRTQK